MSDDTECPTAEVRARGIPFMTRLVPSVMDGTKTQTRRVAKQPKGWPDGWPAGLRYGVDGPGTARTIDADYPDSERDMIRCPYGKPGDRLYVRETWGVARYPGDVYGVNYRAKPPIILPSVPDDMLAKYAPKADEKWRPPMHMPKRFARTWLEITELGIEPIRKISTADVIAEGCAGVPCEHTLELTGAGLNCTDCLNTGWLEPPEVEFYALWDDANERRGYSLRRNPWVWVITFKLIEP